MNAHNIWTRRGFTFGGTALILTACNNGLASNATTKLEGEVNNTLNALFTKYPNSRQIVENSRGVLIVPVTTQAGLGVGGSYGEGALRIGGKTVDYYSATQASVGFQVGARQYSQVLAFQTDQALSNFRTTAGWVAGAGAYYALPEQGQSFGTDTITNQSPVLAMIFGETGIMAGATIEGTKYTRIVPSSLGAL